jgi:hypothetical protein
VPGVNIPPGKKCPEIVILQGSLSSSKGKVLGVNTSPSKKCPGIVILQVKSAQGSLSTSKRKVPRDHRHTPGKKPPGVVVILQGKSVRGEHFSK